MPNDQAHLLSLCRAVMPGVSGVVLSTLDGGVVAHEEARVADPAALARAAVATRSAQTSTLVDHDGALFLVVFVPEPIAPATNATASVVLA